MSIHVALSHITHYRYDRPVKLGPQVVRLRPAPHSRTQVLSYSLNIEPVKHFINWQQDPFANWQARLVFPEPTREFKVTVDLVVEMAVFNPFDFFLEPDAEKFPFKYSETQARELAPYLVTQPATPLVKAYLASTDLTPRRTIDFLVSLNQRLQQDIKYSIRMEPGVQTPEETLALACGSCRDTGWLMVQLFRHLGLAARFVSGYLIQLKADVKSIDGPSGAEHDFTDLHAWCEVFLPGAGWVGLDPTSGLMAGEGHIPLACTPEPSSAAPIEGGVDESEVVFEHHMAVQRIFESPRVTSPYTDDQWASVLKLGEAVDKDLAAGDVRLTMGGEPTFVATSDRDAAEWNIDALGPTKRGYAAELVLKLRAEYGQGGFLHFGQGKWYPGEQLPRWALSIFWRKDGQPVWQNPALFADERKPCRYTSADAKNFVQTLAGKLGLATTYITPGFEDTWYYLWRERRLPVNVDPFDSRLDDPMERERLRRVFLQGLDSVVGYVLPLQTREAAQAKAGFGPPAAPGPKWATGPWFFRDERMYLMPGDSPMGYRLPLDSVPWVSKTDYPYMIEADPFAPRNELPGTAALAARYNAATNAVHATAPPAPAPAKSANTSASAFAQYMARYMTGNAALTEASRILQFRPAPAPAMAAPEKAGKPVQPAEPVNNRAPNAFESAAWLTRTALCVEVRDPSRANGPKDPKDDKAPVKPKADPDSPSSRGEVGALYIFMPPMERLEDYLDLLAAVEATAQTLGVRIVLEGYPPPRDPRLKMLQVTPDPGVIEVNIHPAYNWGELVEHTEFLYRIAHETRLSAEKFMTDGRHTGTGGGNHFVLGGATPADSPFLRKPELLGSLVAYWHNHPSLSYLFSGMFIGPTSQAPRVDEARNDQLYELEIALREIAGNREKYGQDMPPWIVDRTLRNILVDVTGNTHRSEFCIDKMYSPDSATGRLGLLELRAFEMPPHARMSIAQQLLLRALVARFWNKPYSTRMTRWGTELHDRFLLPSLIRMDFADVLTELNEAGYAFDMAWFEPHFEFRFPMIGQVKANSIGLTLRGALEPWHVMGEEGSAGGTVRYVDSSLERVEVHVTGLNDNRYVITVNGRALPLQSTGRVGEYVAGVRYKAWNPPSALHPSIGVHAPLTFDIVDTWMERSLGGCQYHVAHPGGLNYETLPVNSYEAESRRLTRFLRMGHSPGKMQVQPAAPSREFPFTLDLR
ncbi:transglutaminase family protein [Polaromonas sp.]|uniref:transglutaminase family protein n=1 Tax=Polaromonas sp. TaxID=1869339 RepID=UPI002D0633C2|nr:transglutaminase family protein [Polaromonas sp.]HQS30257.1 transglutaminase family protein [Polaromonas sp.]HQS91271.1 transglutaminase family protein [Polaromonas sp.]